MSKKKAAVSKNVFKEAVEATPDIATCYQPGLSALKSNSSKVKVGNTRNLNGSVDIDACTSAQYPQANRWDYAIGYNSEAYFVEAHPASPGEVDVVIKKLNWLKNWLNTKAPELNKIKAKANPFVWVQSGKFDIPKTTPQYRKAVSNGILPIGELKL